MTTINKEDLINDLLLSDLEDKVIEKLIERVNNTNSNVVLKAIMDKIKKEVKEDKKDETIDIFKVMDKVANRPNKTEEKKEVKEEKKEEKKDVKKDKKEKNKKEANSKIVDSKTFYYSSDKYKFDKIEKDNRLYNDMTTFIMESYDKFLNIKYYITVIVIYNIGEPKKPIFKTYYERCKNNHLLLKSHAESSIVGRVHQSLLEVWKSIQKCIEIQNGDTGKEIVTMYFNINVIQVNDNAGSYIKTPDSLKNSSYGLLNIKNQNQKCFIYCVLCWNNQINSKDISQRQLEKYMEDDKFFTIRGNVKNMKFDFSMLSMPPSHEEIMQFEIKNEIMVKIWIQNTDETKDNKVLIEYDGNKQFHTKCIHLLKLYDEDNSHFVLMKKTAFPLLKWKHETQVAGVKLKQVLCNLCNNKITETLYEKHIINCEYGKNIYNNKSYIFEENEIYFDESKFSKKLIQPFLIIFDFEASNNIYTDSINNKTTEFIQTVNSFCYSVIDVYEKKLVDFYIYTKQDESENIVIEFVKRMNIITSYLACIKQQFSEDKQMNPKQKHFFENHEYLYNIVEYNKKNYSEWSKKPSYKNLDKASFNKLKVEIEKNCICHICEKIIEENDDVHRDHDHYNNDIRGLTHSYCNIKYNLKSETPIIAHNLKYDGQFILRNLYEISTDMSYQNKIKAIMLSSEQFMTFSMGNMKFIDSFQFMAASLSKLIQSLKTIGEDKYENFIISRQFKNFDNRYSKYFTEENEDILLNKNYYPYEKVNVEFLNNKKCKDITKTDFDCKVGDYKMTDEEYEDYLNICSKLDISKFRTYHSLYLINDVLALSDICLNFNNHMYSKFKLCPWNYISVPSYAWDCFLKSLKVGFKLQSIPNLEIYKMIIECMRGGYTNVMNQRITKCKNEYINDVEDNSENSYIMYFDENNMYGFSMTKYLPYGDFKMLKNDELYTHDKIMSMKEEDEYGCFIRCDITFNQEAKEKLKNFVPCIESCEVKYEWLSKYQKNYIRSEYNKIKDYEDDYEVEESKLKKYYESSGCKKLIGHFYEHKNYVMHYLHYQQAIKLGVSIKNITEILSFKQTNYMKNYIDMCTKERIKASKDKNDFLVMLMKLMINSVYGKTMENETKRKNIELSVDENQVKKFASSIKFNDYSYCDGLYTVSMNKNIEYKITKPVYIGASVLELSKLTIYDFYYNDVLKYDENCIPLYSDTDSLVLKFKKDPYKWVYQEKLKLDNNEDSILDLSGCKMTYQNNKLDQRKNDKVYGKFKIEEDGKVIKGFYGLQAKTYYIDFNDDKSVKKIKGVPKNNVKNNIDKYDFIDVVKSNKNIQSGDIFRINAHKHQMYVMKSEKTACKSLNDKNYMINNDILVPFGYIN